MRTPAFAAGMAGALLCASSIAAAGTKTSSTWSAPDLQPGAYRKLIVMARFEDEAPRRILEDALAAKLKDAGLEALPAYQVLVPEDLASEAAIRAKVEQLGADAGIVFTVTGDDTKVKSGSNAYASVGVPVGVGPFSVFLGTSVPLGGGPSTVHTVHLKSELHALEGKNPRWIATYDTDLKGGTERVARDLAGLAMKGLKKARLLK
jgi:hypothetical protein